ncbi:MAG: DMT family transporter [Gemmatimonadaceae bacterium]
MRPSLVLFVAVAAISFGGPLTRLSNADPLAVAVWRLGLSLVGIVGFLVAGGGWREWRRLRRRDLGLALGAGTLLAVHFWSWIASLDLTTVAASVVLVNTQPVIVAVLSAVWLREAPVGRQWAGIGIAVAGAAAVAAPHLSTPAGASRTALVGDLLALVGAVTAALYFLAGRRVRATLGLWPYVGLVYGACFVVLVVFAVAVGAPLAPQPPRELAIFAGLAVGPMLVGHTGCNWALKYLPAYVVNVALLGETVGATLLAAVLPGIREVPPATTLVGGALIITGIVVTSKPAR